MGYPYYGNQQQQPSYGPNDMMSYYGGNGQQNPIALAAAASAANAYLSFNPNGNYQQVPSTMSTDVGFGNAAAAVGLEPAIPLPNVASTYHNKRNSNGGGNSHNSERNGRDRNYVKNGEQPRRTLLPTTPLMELSYDATMMKQSSGGGFAATPPYSYPSMRNGRQRIRDIGNNVNHNTNNIYNNENNYNYQMYQQAAAAIGAAGFLRSWHPNPGSSCDDGEYSSSGGYNNQRRNPQPPMRTIRDANRRSHGYNR